MTREEAIKYIQTEICIYQQGCDKCQKEECAFYLAIKALDAPTKKRNVTKYIDGRGGVGMMYEDDIKLIDAWFRAKETDIDKGYSTYHHKKEEDGEDVYSVDTWDVDAFTDFLLDTFPDLVGIPCMLGAEGVWFRTEDLEKAPFL